MIKINLLPEGSERPAGGRGLGRPPTRASLVLLAALSVLLGFAGVGFLGWHWNSAISRLETQLTKEQAEGARLAAIQKQNQSYEKQARELEQRVRTIQALEESRTGPVRLMTALGDTVNRTRDLSLVSVGPEGDRLLVKGQAESVGSIAAFIAALKNSGSFSSVELRQYYQDDQAERMTFKFDLDCVYRQTGTATGTAAPSALQAPSVPRTKS